MAGLFVNDRQIYSAGYPPPPFPMNLTLIPECTLAGWRKSFLDAGQLHKATNHRFPAKTDCGRIMTCTGIEGKKCSPFARSRKKERSRWQHIAIHERHRQLSNTWTSVQRMLARESYGTQNKRISVRPGCALSVGPCLQCDSYHCPHPPNPSQILLFQPIQPSPVLPVLIHSNVCACCPFHARARKIFSVILAKVEVNGKF